MKPLKSNKQRTYMKFPKVPSGSGPQVQQRDPGFDELRQGARWKGFNVGDSIIRIGF